MFHYALRQDGILFLGPSEGITRGAHLFEPIDPKHRLFRRSDTGTATHVAGFSLTRGHCLLPTPPAALGAASTDRIEKVAHAALEKHSPAYVVVNRQNDIIRFSGGEIGRYMEPSAGVATLGLFGILRRSLRQTVRAALEQATVTTGRPVLRGAKAAGIKLADETRAVNVIVEPISGGQVSDPNLCVVAFQDAW